MNDSLTNDFCSGKFSATLTNQTKISAQLKMTEIALFHNQNSLK